MARSRLDRLFEEADRQLVEVREQSAGVAARSGLLFSATAVAAALLAARIDHLQHKPIGALWALGVGTFLGFMTLLVPFQLGPNPVSLISWSKVPSDANLSSLYEAKLMALDANRQRLAVMSATFYLQVIGAVVAIVLALFAAGGYIT